MPHDQTARLSVSRRNTIALTSFARTVWRASAPRSNESGVRTDLIRRYGRGLSGARVPDHTPDGRWHTTTFLGALRVTGLTAPAVFDGPIDGASFLAYIEQVLTPTLAPGDIVIMDNLSCHKSPAVRRARSRRRATLVSAEIQS